MDIKAYLPLFIEETKDNIQQISENLLKLEQDHRDIEAINEIFRAIHTIKGMSATMGYDGISCLAHDAEDYLDLVRNGQGHVTPSLINGIFEVIDEFGSQVDVLVNTGEPSPINQARVEKINRLLRDRNWDQVDNKHGRYKIEVHFSRDCIHRSARAMIICNQLSEISSLTTTNPNLELLSSLESVEKLECEVETDYPDKIRALLENGVEIESFSVEAKEEEVEAPKALDNDKHIGKHSSTIRVDTEKLDQLLNLVSELVINKTSIQQAATVYPILADGVEHLHRLTGDLQTIVMNMRMIPLETVFNRFPRMVRDTAMTLGKGVTLDVQGAETELDRTIIDDIADPLLHLLRNAVDHGIEPADVRKQLGKPPVGKISLRAYQTGSQVIIEVSDNGCGLDVDKIRAKARELGLLLGGELDRSELFNLIFHPGFTTSTSVTDLSGRGVGLDVVKKSIEALGGVIEVLSEKNSGTTFRISLPLTLAIIQGLLVQCGSEIYVVPLSYVQETEVIYRSDIQLVGKQQIVMFRGQVLPIVFLSHLLGADQTELDELSLVVVRHGEIEVGIIVDDLLTQQEIVIKNISWGESFFRGFLGSTILGDGSVVLIIDVNVLLSAVKNKEG